MHPLSGLGRIDFVYVKGGHSRKNFAFMRQNNSQDARDLEAYFDFLDDIGAFESKKIKTEFYDAEFEL
jgi:hypothetical protein